MDIKIKALDESVIIPTKATGGSVAYDLYAPENLLIKSGRQVINLHFAIELPTGYEAKIEPRSGYSSKGFAGAYVKDGGEYRFDCDVLTGKIDYDYRGPVGVIVNNRDRAFYISRGQRIAQMTIYKVEETKLVEVDELSETDRGAGGFGSTGN